MTHIPDSCYHLTIILILKFFSGKNVCVCTHNHYDWYSTATNTYTTRRGERWWISRKDYTWDEVIRRSWTSEVDYHETDFRTETGWPEKGKHDENWSLLKFRNRKKVH